MSDDDVKDDQSPVTWRDLRAALADVIGYSSDFTLFAISTGQSEEERRAAESELRKRAAELERKYGLDEFMSNG